MDQRHVFTCEELVQALPRHIFTSDETAIATASAVLIGQAYMISEQVFKEIQEDDPELEITPQSFNEFAANMSTDLVDSRSLRAFGPEAKVDKGSQTCLVMFHPGGDLLGYPIRVTVPDEDSQHLITRLQGGFIIHKVPEGYVLDQVRAVLGPVAHIRRNAWFFDREATEPGETTSAGEWAFLDAVWEEWVQMPEN